MMLPSTVIQVRPKTQEQETRRSPSTATNLIKQKGNSKVAYIDTDKSGLTGNNGSSMNTSNGMPSARHYKKSLPKKMENNKKKELIVVNKDVEQVSMGEDNKSLSSNSSSLSSDESSDSSDE